MRVAELRSPHQAPLASNTIPSNTNDVPLLPSFSCLRHRHRNNTSRRRLPTPLYVMHATSCIQFLIYIYRLHTCRCFRYIYSIAGPWTKTLLCVPPRVSARCPFEAALTQASLYDKLVTYQLQHTVVEMRRVIVCEHYEDHLIVIDVVVEPNIV